jgi:predicted RNase H-like HicB family nuclease
MKDSDRYLKIVEWSEEDSCYLGSALGLIEYCCHGDNEVDVFKQLCVITDEWVAVLNSQHKELPVPIVYQQHRAGM